MTRSQARALLGHLAALLPWAVPDIVDGVLVEHWAGSFESIDLSCEGDADDVTEALHRVVATWDSARWPSPAHVLAGLGQLRSTRTRLSALSAARAAIANSTVPSLDPIRTPAPRRHVL